MSFTKEFPIVMREVEKKVKEMENWKKKREAQARSYTTAKDPARTLEDDFKDSNYITDAELLSAAEKVLVESDIAVKTKVTTVGKLVPSSDRKAADPLACSSGEDATTVIEGWHKSWEDPHQSAMVMPNIKWMKENLEFGLFHPAKPYKNNRGEVVPRKTQINHSRR